MSQYNDKDHEALPFYFQKVFMGSEAAANLAGTSAVIEGSDPLSWVHKALHTPPFAMPKEARVKALASLGVDETESETKTDSNGFSWIPNPIPGLGKAAGGIVDVFGVGNIGTFTAILLGLLLVGVGLVGLFLSTDTGKKVAKDTAAAIAV